ncbi:MAG: ATP-binding cassette domain-containing protein [Prevotella sp.]|nr:ATP-binding cassette domain-containing protein [Prevotella sp.]
MNTIRLKNIVPQVFAVHPDLQSEVWRQDLTLEKGKKYLVEADSGMGKSTFCSYLIGYRHDFTGELFFDNRKSTDFTPKDWTQLRQRHVSSLFQELRLFPELTALENVQIKNRLTNFATDDQIDEWFNRLKISDKRHEKIGVMSFGQQQRVALIRALAQPFDFLLADEPVSHLDDGNGELMGRLIAEEAARQGAAVIVTSIGKHIPLDYDKTIKL